MPLLSVFIAAVTIFFAYAEIRIVSTNGDSSASSSVSAVTIDTDQRLVTIDLFHRRRCDNPTFMVRLSGTALYLLSLEGQDFQPLPSPREGPTLLLPRRNSYFYHYPAIQDSGIYFLEVIILLCEAFRPENLIGNCVEDYSNGRNIVTGNNSFLLNATLTEKYPRWVLREKSKLAALPTRIQQRTCASIPGDKRPCELRQDPSDIWQHRLYDWVDGVDWKSAYDKAGAPTAKVCFVGASHSRELTRFAKALNSPGIGFHHIESRYPDSFSMKDIVESACNYAVIGYGQWTASWIPIVPYDEARYRSAMGKVLATIANERTSAGTKFFIRSVNYNGLSSAITACPPIDHRVPPEIEMMNSILAEQAALHQVPYIDLSHIIGPMWDSAPDFCHPEEPIFSAEVKWIVHSIFLPATPSAAPPVLIRFTDSNAVYLVKDRVARAFPDGGTFMKMGYDFSNVSVIHAMKRYRYVIAESLPRL